MSVMQLLDNLFFGSLLTIYGSIFSLARAASGSVGWTLVLFSLVLNLTLLPVYYQMERAGKTTGQRRDAMNKEVARLKKHYKGRERFYYIQTLQRQFQYRPIAAVFSAGDLYLQVLVFTTVYRYLTTNPALAGAAFGPIANLNAPDGLLAGVHLLPIAMTVLNIASMAFYTADKNKQRSGLLIALLFLALLYRSPAGVVLYWTSNNAFSLVRNAIQRGVVPSLPNRVLEWFSRLAHQA